ncbi:MAG: DNA-binding protein, partial [Bacteroidales bacterium]|nr:DNA-binding protein [Bacteroidales bacterium]
MEKVFALIGDIIDSKSLKNRKDIQNNLHKLLDGLNQKYESSIVSNLTLTLGDEFQGLFKDVECVLLVMDEINLTLSLKGINVRFGVGYGEITTDINPELSIGADGEAFWFARDAITHIRKYHF